MKVTEIEKKLPLEHAYGEVLDLTNVEVGEPNGQPRPTVEKAPKTTSRRCRCLGLMLLALVAGASAYIVYRYTRYASNDGGADNPVGTGTNDNRVSAQFYSQYRALYSDVEWNDLVASGAVSTGGNIDPLLATDDFFVNSSAHPFRGCLWTLRGNFHTLDKNLQAKGHAQTSMPSWMSSREFRIQDASYFISIAHCLSLSMRSDTKLAFYPIPGRTTSRVAFYAIPRLS
jgi:hypothetical protein